MKTTTVLRAFVLILASSLLPACYTNNGRSYMAPGGSGAPPGATVLLSDNFLVFPGTLWSAPALTNSTTAASVYNGSDYRLQLAAPTRTAGTAPSAQTRSTTTFNSHALTVAIDILMTAQSTVGDIASVVIESSPAHGVLARADLDSAGSTLIFSIQGTASAPIAISPGTLYRVSFLVDSGDLATWKLGSGTPTAAVALSAQVVDVALQANWAMGTPVSNPVFQFRDALVTTP